MRAQEPTVYLPADHYMSIADVADYLHVTRNTVRRWIDDGLLTAHRAGPRFIRVRRSEVEAMLSPVPAAGGRDDAA